MQSDKSPDEIHRGRNRRNSWRKDENCVAERAKDPNSEETTSSSLSGVSVGEDWSDIVEQETSLQNLDSGDENDPTASMCPMLRRQLQTHKNVLRLLHEYKLASTQINGQRILSIQPMRWSGPSPGIDCEIFVGRIPKTIYEDTLYPLFKLVGEIFQIRLMVDMAELTRGYCFIMYTNPRDAACAITQLDQYEIAPGRKIRVLASVNKCKLYVGPLPCNIGSEEVVKVIYASAWDIEYVSTYRFPNHDAAYAIIAFKSHRNAALARRKLRPERLFKCSEYEDRGTVKENGEVQITQKYLRSDKPTTYSSDPLQDNSNRYQNYIPPICPPDSNGPSNHLGPVNGGNGTRYSTMLAMSAAMEESPIFNSHSERFKFLADTDNNKQLLEGRCNLVQDKTRWRDADGNSFPNFDMWNSNLVSDLPVGLPVKSDTLEHRESPNEITWNETADDWKNSGTYPSSNGALSFNRYRYPNGIGISSYVHRPCFNPSAFNGVVVDQNRPFTADIIHCQPRENNSTMPYYVLLRHRAYFYPEEAVKNDGVNVVGYPLNSLSVNYDRRSYPCNRQAGNNYGTIAIDRNFAGKFDNWRQFRQHAAAMSAKTGNCDRAVNSLPSSYGHNYLPEPVSNCKSVYAPEDTSSSRLLPFDTTDGNGARYPRPILKRMNCQNQQ